MQDRNRNKEVSNIERAYAEKNEEKIQILVLTPERMERQLQTNE